MLDSETKNAVIIKYLSIGVIFLILVSFSLRQQQTSTQLNGFCRHIKTSTINNKKALRAQGDYGNNIISKFSIDN